ncbi:uncharacterized protein LOC144936841 [Lampetra fluviatilis]
MEAGKIAGLYDLEKTLGRGHFAVVKLARHVFTGEKVAVKVIDKSKLDPMATSHLFQEVRCMKLVQHPNVVRLYEVIDTQTKLYLILELADGGDLYDYIMRHEGGLQEELAKTYFAQVVHAISYCHRLHVVHRDLKPENVVFFEKQGLVKLTDFGFSNLFQPGTKLATSCGSLAYSAPEILLGDEYDAPAVDIWSLGVILYMLVCGHPPFQEANDSETLTMIMDCKYTVPAHISRECKDLIARMLQRDPRRRASLQEMEGHPWLCGVDPSPAAKCSTPLISYKSLSEDEHNGIVQRMVLGSIAERDAIVEALEADRYNHITATYFLLAERILKDKLDKQMQSPRSGSPSAATKAHFRQSWPARINISQEITDLSGPGTSAGPQGSPADGSSQPSMGTLTPARAAPSPGGTGGGGRKSVVFTVGEGEEEDEEEEEKMEAKRKQQQAVQVVLRRRPSLMSRITSRKSAPLLNQICEEAEGGEGCESEDELSVGAALAPQLNRLRMSLASPGTAHKRYPRGRRTAGTGRPSPPHGQSPDSHAARPQPMHQQGCSSSETSDDDNNNGGGGSGLTGQGQHEDGPPGGSGGGGGGGGDRGGGGGGAGERPSHGGGGGGSNQGGEGGGTQPGGGGANGGRSGSGAGGGGGSAPRVASCTGVQEVCVSDRSGGVGGGEASDCARPARGSKQKRGSHGTGGVSLPPGALCSRSVSRTSLETVHEGGEVTEALAQDNWPTLYDHVQEQAERSGITDINMNPTAAIFERADPSSMDCDKSGPVIDAASHDDISYGNIGIANSSPSNRIKLQTSLTDIMETESCGRPAGDDISVCSASDTAPSKEAQSSTIVTDMSAPSRQEPSCPTENAGGKGGVPSGGSRTSTNAKESLGSPNIGKRRERSSSVTVCVTEDGYREDAEGAVATDANANRKLGSDAGQDRRRQLLVRNGALSSSCAGWRAVAPLPASHLRRCSSESSLLSGDCCLLLRGGGLTGTGTTSSVATGARLSLAAELRESLKRGLALGGRSAVGGAAGRSGEGVFLAALSHVTCCQVV